MPLQPRLGAGLGIEKMYQTPESLGNRKCYDYSKNAMTTANVMTHMAISIAAIIFAFNVY